MPRPAPLPPVELATRVGPGPGSTPLEAYEREGAAVRQRIEALLPSDWTWDGRHVLDFGCGSARVLRHFLDEARVGEFWGCDIDQASIEWIQANLSPPLRVFRNELKPPLALPSSSLDLIWATSVFTHIESWSAWLLEMHRILKPGGVLVASYLGEGMWDALVGEPYREDEVGMTVLKHWVDGGPGAWVFHSEWWLRTHWGRAFDVLEVARPPRTADGGPQITHSYIALSRRDGDFSQTQLERRDPDESRELAALDTTVRLLRGEIDEILAKEASTLSIRELLVRSSIAPHARRLRHRLRSDVR